VIDAELKPGGFRQSSKDPCLHILERKEGIICLWLDINHCFAMYNDEDMYHRFFSELKDEYKLSSSADNNMFLVTEIVRTTGSEIEGNKHTPKCYHCGDVGSHGPACPRVHDGALDEASPRDVHACVMSEEGRWGQAPGHGPPRTQDAEEEELRQDADVESKHSESLLVARPDGQHKGSNDMAQRVLNMGVARTSARRDASAQAFQQAREYSSHHVARLQQVIGTLRAAHAELQEHLKIATAKWEQAAGRTYSSMGAGRCHDIEVLKTEIAEYEVQIATAQIMLSEGSSRAMLIKRGALAKLEAVLVRTIPLAGHLTAEQIVERIDIEFDWSPRVESDGSLRCHELLGAIMDVDTETAGDSEK